MTEPTTDELLHEGDRWTLRRVDGDTARDALRDLLRRLPLGSGRLCVTEDRGEDPLLLRAVQADPQSAPQVYVAFNAEERPVGSLVVVHEQRRLGPDLVPVGQVCDVRFDPELRGARAFPAALRAALEHAEGALGTEVFHTVILGDDAHTRSAFLHRREGRFEQPMAQMMSRLDLALLPLAQRTRGPGQVLVQRASALDLDALIAFLRRTESTRRLGLDVGRASLARRFQGWPGFGVESFFVARTKGARIVGCAALLDLTQLRRFERVLPPGAGRLRGLGLALRSHLAGSRALPRPGRAPQLGMLSHVEIDGDDPGIFLDLVRGAHCELAATTDLDLIGVAVPQDSPLVRALTSLPGPRVPLSLLALTRAGTPWNNVDFRTARPGFEPAFG